MTRLPLLLLVALALAFPATADAKTCTTKSVYSWYEVTGVSCKYAKKIFKDFLKNGSPAKGGFDCKDKQYPGGVTTTCTKGDKKVVHYSAD